MEISGYFKGADRSICQIMYTGILLLLFMLGMPIWMNRANKYEITKIGKIIYAISRMATGFYRITGNKLYTCMHDMGWRMNV